MHNKKRNTFQLIIVLLLAIAMLFGQVLEVAQGLGGLKGQNEDKVASANSVVEKNVLDEEQPPDLGVGLGKVTPTPREIIVPPAEPSLEPSEPVLTPTPPAFDIWQPAPIYVQGDFVWVPVVVGGVTLGVRITNYTGAGGNVIIPDTIDDNGTARNVIEIGDHAFQSKNLTGIVLPAHLQLIGEYAFTDNAIVSTAAPANMLVFPDSLTEIKQYAFRDNVLEDLVLGGATSGLKKLGSGAFMKNKLKTLSFNNVVQELGNSVFEGNKLIQVNMPDSITAMGVRTFALNGRYVKVVTTNPIIQTEYVPNAFGHVVNPITIVIRSVDPNGAMLLSDVVLGADLSIPGEVFSAGVPVSYTPREIINYWAGVQNFTPTGDGYVHTVVYLPTTIPPVIVKENFMVPMNATAEEVELLIRLGLSATDLTGADISADVVCTHAIDTGVVNTYPVNCTVTDRYGNVGMKSVQAIVGGDWMLFPIGNGWVLGDFNYDGAKVTGLSALGQAKYDAGNTNVVMPHLNPNLVDANNLPTTPITEIADGAFGSQEFTTLKLGAVTELTRIGVNAFMLSPLAVLDLSHNPLLQNIDDNAFVSSQLTILDLSRNPELLRIGEDAFYYSNIQSFDFSHNPLLEVIDNYAFAMSSGTGALLFSGNNALTKIGDVALTSFQTSTLSFAGAPNLTYIGKHAFEMSNASQLDLSQNAALLYIGEQAFSTVDITDLDLSGCTELTHIGAWAFYDVPLTAITFGPKLSYIGEYAFLSYTQPLSTASLPALEYIGNGAFNMVPSVDLTGSPNLKVIGDYAFYAARNTVLDLSQNTELRFIGSRAFYNSELTSLDLSHNTKLEHIGTAAFSGSQLKELDFGVNPNLRVIGEEACKNAKLTRLDLGGLSGLRTIGNYAFSSSPLVSLNLRGASELRYIGHTVFHVAQLSSLDLSGNTMLSHIGDRAFAMSPITELRFGSNPNLSYIGLNAFMWAQINTSLDLSGLTGLALINDNAFNSSAMTEIRWPEPCALQKIGSSVFSAAELNNLDLSSCHQLKALGNAAFSGSSLSEVWISEQAQFYLEERTPNTSQLYAGLIPVGAYRLALFRSHSVPAATTSDPTGARNVSNNIDYLDWRPGSNNVPGDYAYRSASLAYPWSEVLIAPPYVDGGSVEAESPSVGGSNAPFLVNPTRITVHSVDNAVPANTILPDRTLWASSSGTETVTPRPIYGYHSPLPQTVNLDAPEKEITFVYVPMTPEELADATLGFRLEHRYNTAQVPGPYLIGDQMTSRVYVDLTGFTATLIGARIQLCFDDSVYDKEAIRVSSSPLVNRTELEGNCLNIYLNNMSGGTNLELPIVWRFKKYVTPEMTPYPITGELIHNNQVRARANDIIFRGRYPDPYLVKLVNGESVDGALLFQYGASEYGDDAVDGMEGIYIDFTYRTAYVTRNVGAWTMTDILPTYTKLENHIETTATAIFEPDVNPGWTLSADGKSVSFAGDAENSLVIHNPVLKLRFPYAKYYQNITNRVEQVLTPFGKTPEENLMVVRDQRIFNFGADPSSGDVFVKVMRTPRYSPDTAYFYDNENDRAMTYTWDVYINTKTLTANMRDVLVSDYSLDPRLYYTGVNLPDEFISGELRLIDAGGTIFRSMTIGSTEINLSREDGLNTKRIEIALSSLPQGKLYNVRYQTRLIDPDNTHFDPTPGSSANAFLNMASLDGKVDGSPIHVEDDAFLMIAMAVQLVSPVKQQFLEGNEGDQTALRGYSVEYRLHVRDNSVGQAQRDPLDDFLMLDLMPEHISLEKVQLSACFQNSLGTYRQQANYNGSGRLALIFESPQLAIRCEHIATLTTRVDPDAPEGDYDNEVYMDFTNANVTNIGEAVYDEIDPTRSMSRAEAHFTLATPVAVSSFKSIRQDSASPWSYTGIETLPEAPFDYRLSILNDTDEPRSDIVLVEVLPYIGDTAITTNNEGVRVPRESRFANSFDTSRAVTISVAGYIVSYYNSDTPIVYSGTTEATLDGLAWVGAPANNTKAIRIEANPGTVIAPHGSLHVIIPMLAPANSAPDYPLSGQRAWNTFVRRDDSTRDVNGNPRYLEPNRIYNEIPRPLANLQLRKVDELSPANPLAGAEFALRDSAGLLIGTAISGADGLIRFTNIPLDSYTITEISAPTGYDLLSIPITVSLAQLVQGNLNLDLGDIVNIKTPPPPILGAALIEKVNALGAPMAGVQFTIRGLGGTPPVRQSGRTGTNGRIQFPDLPVGSYVIEETGPLWPFRPVSQFYCTIRIGNLLCDFTGSHAIKNEIVSLKIVKLGIPAGSLKPITDYNELDGSVLTAAVFQIFAEDGITAVTGPILYENVPGRGNGWWAENLHVNTHLRLREVTAPPYYTPLGEDVHFLIDENGQLFHLLANTSGGYDRVPFNYGAIYVPNMRILQTGRVRIQKQDGSGNGLGGVEFTLFKQQAGSSWAILETLTTGASGQAQSSLLHFGNYRLEETLVPAGYLPATKVEYFNIPEYSNADAGDPIGLTFDYTFTNYHLDLSLLKFEMVRRALPYSQALIDLAALQAGECPECRIVDGNYFDVPAGSPPNVIVHIVRPLSNATFELALNGTVLLTDTSGADGLITIPASIQIDPNATYTLREITPPNGFEAIPGTINVRIADYTSATGFNGQIRVGLENKRILGQVSVSKYNRPGMLVLPGVSFMLTPTNPVGVPTTKVTNESGSVTWTNLPFGEYQLVETATQPDYDLDPTVITFTIDAENTSHYFVRYNLQNIRDIQVVKVLRGVTPVTYLKGATFALYNMASGTEVEVSQGTTDDHGVVTFSRVPYGTYRIREIAAPAGYRLNLEPIDFVLDTTTDPIVSFTVEDSAGEYDLPDTGTAGSLGFMALGLALLGVAAVFAYKRRTVR